MEALNELIKNAAHNVITILTILGVAAMVGTMLRNAYAIHIEKRTSRRSK